MKLMTGTIQHLPIGEECIVHAQHGMPECLHLSSSKNGVTSPCGYGGLTETVTNHNEITTLTCINYTNRWGINYSPQIAMETSRNVIHVHCTRTNFFFFVIE